MDLSETQKAYLAGIIDGEGSVSILSVGKGRYCLPRVVISNTNLELIQTLKAWLNEGCLSMKTRSKYRNRTLYELTFRTKSTKQILELIQPYLIVKKKHTALVLEYIEENPKRKWIHHQHPLTERQIEIFHQVRALRIKIPS